MAGVTADTTVTGMAITIKGMGIIRPTITGSPISMRRRRFTMLQFPLQASTFILGGKIRIRVEKNTIKYS